MPKSSPLQSNFGGGEWSPKMHGRVDLERYRTALAELTNAFPTVQGSLERHPGTYFVAETKSNAKARLEAFEFSTTQAYILEFGDQYIRFYMNHGQIESGGSPYEVATPYLEADVFDLKFTQSADTLYITHPNYAPRKLTRTAHTSWTLSTISFSDGPYLPLNTSSVTLVCSSATGNVAVDASSGMWAATDVGRLIRFDGAPSASTVCWLRITSYTSATRVNADVVFGTAPTSVATQWRLGLWSDTTGYPAASCFHEDRLWFVGTRGYPLRWDGSRTGAYEDFAPTLSDGSVTDGHAVSFTISASKVNNTRWITSDEKGLLGGGLANEWIVRPSAQTEVITPTNVTAKPASSAGSADVQPVQMDKATIFVQRGGRKLREFTYFYDADGFRANDLTILADHALDSGVVQLAVQKIPQPIVWAVRNDGTLASMTYERDSESIRAGWCKRIVGGVGTGNGGADPAIVESVAVIPEPNGTYEEAWVVVRRVIGGSIVRYVEYMTRIFDDEMDQRDAVMLDSALTFDNPIVITGITKANPAVVTAAAHGFSTGDRVELSKVNGFTSAPEESAVNSLVFTVTALTADTFELDGLDSTNFSPYISGGEARKLVSSLSGLNHLANQTVDTLVDGTAVADIPVDASGNLTLPYAGAVIHAGLRYQTRIKLLRLEAGAADGTALGKTRRTHNVSFLVHRTLGMRAGFSFDDLSELQIPSVSTPLAQAAELFSGIIGPIGLEADYDTENQICIEQSRPLPLSLLAVIPQLHTQDR